MIQVQGWIFANLTVSQVGVEIYDTQAEYQYDWQYTPISQTFVVTNSAQQFMYAPWFTLTGRLPGYYTAKFGIFNNNNALIYSLPFSFTL